MGKTILVALGGNALIKPGQKGTAKQQLENLQTVAEHIVNLYNQGFRIVLTHGNGPQVGNILLAQEKAQDYSPPMPLYVCVAESQGMIGYFLQEALYNHLRKRGFDLPVVTVLTQVLVDQKDQAFHHFTKPIGPVYHDRSRIPKDWKLTATIDGFRRVVPSPRPKKIIEEAAIMKLSREALVIACGGGGIPVIKERGLKGIDAVIDKDLTAALLAQTVKAHTFVILTDEDFVYLNYKKPHQKKLTTVSLQQIKDYASQGHFPPGSMGPKIQAAIRFLEHGGKKVVITHINKLEEGVRGEWGTVIE